MLYLFCCTREEVFEYRRKLNPSYTFFIYSKFIPPSKFTTPPLIIIIVFVKRAELQSGDALLAFYMLGVVILFSMYSCENIVTVQPYFFTF